MQKPLATSEVVQIAFLVNDINKTAQIYADFLGVEVPEIVETAPFEDAKTIYRGASTNARAKLAFIPIGQNVQLELIQPDHQPSVWRECLDVQGEGFHHVAFAIQNTAEKTKNMEAAGFSSVQTGEYEGGRYAYFDAANELKMFIETLENDGE